MRKFPLLLLVPCTLVFAVAVHGDSASFHLYANFPQTAKYNLVGAALPDGRLVIWNGDGVFVQPMANADRFDKVAGGYAGDPAFIALSPDGHMLLMGAGGFMDPYTDHIYALDMRAPQDFTPASVVLSEPHYAGAFLTENLVIVDAGTPTYSSELVILDLSAKSAPVPVVVKGDSYAKDAVVPKPGYAANVGVDYARGRVYAMDAATLELRWFTVAELLEAYHTSSVLDWVADGTLIGVAGSYFSGGVVGITPEGNLVMAGALGWGMPGGVQIVNPDSGAVIADYDVDGQQGYASAIYNSVTGVIVAFVNGVAYASEEPQAVPAPGVAGLAVLATVIVLRAAAKRKAP